MVTENSWPSQSQSLIKQEQESIKCELDHLTIPFDGVDVWEIDHQLLKFECKVASGSYGDLYKGTYCSQEVAIKILKSERLNTELQKEFAQEVYIMRKVRHKNVVQFIGACTRPPNLCIVTEYMSGGSVYDYLHKQKGSFKLPAPLKVAIDVSKGMNYLHQNNIIHRDLKAANLLMDENEILLAAGDTFRAAASDQLEIWAERTGCEIVVAKQEKAKASSVISQAVKRGKEEGFDIVLCDTSGRLHTNYSLMEDLVACKKAISKVVAGAPNEILLVLDGTTGLNMLPQAREFNDVVGVTGLILTKLDGSARGGCVVSVVDELGIPVKFVGVGEGVEDLQPFNAEEFVNAIFP